MRMGRAMFKQGKPGQDVYNELDNSVKLDSKTINPWIYLAYLYEEAKNHEKAKRMIEQAVSTNGKELNVMLAAAKWA